MSMYDGRIHGWRLVKVIKIRRVGADAGLMNTMRRRRIRANGRRYLLRIALGVVTWLGRLLVSGLSSVRLRWESRMGRLRVSMAVLLRRRRPCLLLTRWS